MILFLNLSLILTVLKLYSLIELPWLYCIIPAGIYFIAELIICLVKALKTPENNIQIQVDSDGTIKNIIMFKDGKAEWIALHGKVVINQDSDHA